MLPNVKRDGLCIGVDLQQCYVKLSQCPLSDNSGQRWNLARDGLSAYDAVDGSSTGT